MTFQGVKENTNLFTWGKVIDTYEVGPYQIVKHAAHLYRDGHQYHVFLNNKDMSYHCDSLREALVTAIAFEAEGKNSQAAQYFMKMIKEDT